MDDWRQAVMRAQGQCPQCEQLRFMMLLYRSFNTALISMCADYERRLAPEQRITAYWSGPSDTPDPGPMAEP